MTEWFDILHTSYDSRFGGELKSPLKRRAKAQITEPRQCSDPRIDAAARDVANAILQEDGNLESPNSVLQHYATAVVVDERGRHGGGVPSAALASSRGPKRRIVFEWNVNRIIHDRIWDWIKWMALEGPEVLEGNPPLPKGYFRAQLYHRCDQECNKSRMNLLHESVRWVSNVSLTACYRSGTVHLCRANTTSCTSLSETHDSHLVCQESGMVCADAGGHMSGAGDVGFVLGQRALEYGLGAIDARGDSDPENARRADIVDTIRKSCPQITGWNRETGELTVAVGVVPDEARGEIWFDPSFYWLLPEALAPSPSQWSNGTARSDGSSLVEGPILGSKPISARTYPAMSYSRKVAIMSHRTKRAKTKAQRSIRAKNARMASQDRLHSDSELMSDQEAIERVLDHVLWDVETRISANEAKRLEVREAISANLRERMSSRSVGDLLTSLMKQQYEPHSTTTTKEIRGAPSAAVAGDNGGAFAMMTMMSTDELHSVAMDVISDMLVPIVPFDEKIHTQLVKVVLYLWTFVAHIPTGLDDAGKHTSSSNSGAGAGGNHAKRRRYNKDRAADITQFTLAVLYTAAANGINIQECETTGHRGWPRDWWLANNLPSESLLHLYRGATRSLRDHASLRQNSDQVQARSRVDMLEPDAERDRRKRHRIHQTAPLYTPRDVAMGNRELVNALCMYKGTAPSPQEVSAFLNRAFSDAYDHHHHHHHRREGSLDPDCQTEKNKKQNQRQEPSHGNVTCDKEGTPPTTTKTANNMNTTVRFCCMYVPKTPGAGCGAHICVMFNPNDPNGPPVARDHGAKRTEWALDTAVGPFVRNTDAKAFCIEWSRYRHNIDDRRMFGITLAHRLGLGIWLQQEHMEIVDTPSDDKDDDDDDKDVEMPLAPAATESMRPRSLFDLWPHARSVPAASPSTSDDVVMGTSMIERKVYERAKSEQRSASLSQQQQHDQRSAFGPAQPKSLFDFWAGPRH